MTVLGPIPAQSLGITLPHEHLFIDLRFIKAKNEWTTEKISIRNLHRLAIDYTCLSDNLLLNSIVTAIDEIKQYSKFGGCSVVEVSSIGTGRKPCAVKRVSEATKVNMVIGTGFYVKQTMGQAVLQTPAAKLLKSLLRECVLGYRNSGIRPGIIGEIGVGPQLDEWDLKSLRIACELQKETGLPLSIHIQAVPIIKGFTKPNGVKVVDMLEKYGADLHRTVIGHSDAKIDMEYLHKLLRRGVYVELDHFGKNFYFPETNFQMSNDMDRIQAISALIADGNGSRLLISSDLCLKQDLIRYGGHGYAHLLETVVPMMLSNGISPDSIDLLMRSNPQELLAIDPKYL